jgi:penicillin amidase
VVIGHNDRIAWGVTNEAPDSMDVFIEKVEDDTHYTAPDGSRQFEVRVETIEVAGGDPVEIDVRSTIHGPVISEVYVDDGSLAGSERVEVPPSFVTTLSWTALQPGTTVEAIIDYNQASNWDEFRAAVAKFQIAAQNFVYADVEGNIGYQSTGKIPVRDGWDGRYPAAGWLHEPVDTFLDPTGLPSMFNPPSGFILTANQPVNRVGPGDGTGQYIGSDHSTGYRASRIFELLEGTSGATVEDLLAIQLDVADGSAGYLVPLLIGLEIEGAEPLLDLLSGWSPPYAMDGDSAAAAAYAGVWAHLVTNTFADDLGASTPEDHSRLFGVFWELVQRPDDLWWDDTSTADARETRDSILAASVADAYADLKERLGEDTTKWRWGDLHTFQNQTFGKSGIGPIEAIFNRTSPPELGGGGEIVNAIGWTAVNGYEVDWLPSFRMVVDLSDFGSSMAVHTTGQSGHAYHPNYFDMNPHWVEGTALPLPWGEIAGDTLVLTPG